MLAVDLQVTRFFSDGQDLNWHLDYSITGASLPSLATLKIYKSYDGSSLDELLVTGVFGEITQGPHTQSVIPPSFTDTETDYYLVATIQHSNEVAPETAKNARQYEGGAFKSGSVLHVHGGDLSTDPETITVSQSTNLVVTSDNGSGDLNLTYTTAAAGITEIHARLHGGGDTLSSQSNVTKPLWVFGGEGNDTLTTGSGADRIYGDNDAVAAASIVDRKIFYNQSTFDGNDAAANASDDAAIATDKNALLPGETATFKNYTSFYRGINGVMVDVANPRHIPTAADFSFAVGNSSTPSSWTPLATAPAVSVRSGAGLNGSDRVTLTWPNTTISKQWLRITAKSSLGLPAADVFYFGNAIGESGNSTVDARVSSTDELQVRNNPHSVFSDPVGVTHPFDFDRNGGVSSFDELTAQLNGTTPATALVLIAPPFESSSNDIINAGAGNDSVYAFAGGDDLRGNDGDDTFTIGNGVVLQGQSSVLVARGEVGNDTFILRSSSPGTQVHLVGGAATLQDTYHIGGLTTGSLDAIQGYVMVNTDVSAHYDQLFLNDQLATTGHTYYLTNNSLVRSELGGSINFNGSEIDDIRLQAGQGNDIISVPTSPVYVYVYGNGGDDQLMVTNSFATAVADGGDGDDSITTTAPGFANSTTSAVGGSGNDVFRAVLPAINSLSINGGIGEDTFDGSNMNLSGNLTLPPISGVEVVDLKHSSLDRLPLNLSSLSSTLTTLDLRYNSLNLGDYLKVNGANPFDSLTSLRKLYLYGNADPNLAVQPDPDLTMLKGKVLRVDLQPVGLEAAERQTTASAAISAIAKSLHYLPLEIYEYVLNNYEFQLYAGFMKGVGSTIRTKAGNAWDLSKLLIELFADAGTTGNYAVGSGRRTGTHFLTDDKLYDWIGTKSVGANDTIFASSGLAPDYSNSTGIQFNHTWVIANLPGFGDVPFDAAYKVTEWSPLPEVLRQDFNAANSTNYSTLAQLLRSEAKYGEHDNFDPGETDYFTEVPSDLYGLRSDLPHEWYRDRVADLLAKKTTGHSLASFDYRGPIQWTTIDSPPSGITPTIVSGGTGGSPANMTHRIEVSLSYGASLSPWSAPVLLDVPNVADQTIVLRWTGNSPHLYVGGNDQTTFAGSIPAGETHFTLKVRAMDPAGGAGGLPPEHSSQYQRTVGTIASIGLDANQIHSALIYNLQSQLNDASLKVKSLNDVAQFTQADVGLLSSQAINRFFYRVDQAQELMDPLFQTISLRAGIAVGVASADLAGASSRFDATLQNPLVPAKLFVDVPDHYLGGVSREGDADGTSRRSILTLRDSSAQEHSVWEEVTSTMGASTVKSFQAARQQGIPVTTFSPAAWSSTLAADDQLAPGSRTLRMSQRAIDGISEYLAVTRILKTTGEPAPAGTPESDVYHLVPQCRHRNEQRS